MSWPEKNTTANNTKRLGKTRPVPISKPARKAKARLNIYFPLLLAISMNAAKMAKKSSNTKKENCPSVYTHK
jgi:hypothetical protein